MPLASLSNMLNCDWLGPNCEVMAAKFQFCDAILCMRLIIRPLPSTDEIT